MRLLILMVVGLSIAGCVDHRPAPPLVATTRAGNLQAMQALLDAGADPNQHDGRQTDWTPLMHAIHKQQLDALRLLLERGADPNAATDSGTTPLLLAAIEPDPRYVELLLAHGANPRVKGEYGDTPLGRAVSGGLLADIDRPLVGGCHGATVRALLAHDSSLRLPEGWAGREARFAAWLKGCDDVLRLVDSRQ